MSRKIMIFPAFLLSPLCLTDQEYGGEANFIWAKATFEQDDAGYRHVIDQKGVKAGLLNALLLTK